MSWYSSFNRNGVFLNCLELNGTMKLPMLFTKNPDLKDGFVSYCYKNISILSNKLMQTYLFSTALPSLLEKRKIETHNYEMRLQELLHKNNLTTLHPKTVGNRINLL